MNRFAIALRELVGDDRLARDALLRTVFDRLVHTDLSPEDVAMFLLSVLDVSARDAEQMREKLIALTERHTFPIIQVPR